MQVPLDQYLQARGTIVAGFWFRCSSGYLREYQQWEILHSGVASYTTGWSSAEQVRKNIKSDIGSAGGPPCENNWVWTERTYDMETLPLTRSFLMWIAYPLQQTSGTLQITGVTVKFAPGPSAHLHRPPTFRCFGCQLSGNADFDLRATDNTSIVLIDTVVGEESVTESTASLPPYVGDGGHLARGMVAAGDRIWTPASMRNLIANGEFFLGMHADRHVENVWCSNLRCSERVESVRKRRRRVRGGACPTSRGAIRKTWRQ